MGRFGHWKEPLIPLASLTTELALDCAAAIALFALAIADAIATLALELAFAAAAEAAAALLPARLADRFAEPSAAEADTNAALAELIVCCAAACD